jgi:hypothetical protein
MSIEKLALRALISYFLVELVLVPGLSLSQPYLITHTLYQVHALLFCFSLLGVHDLVPLPTTRSIMDILHTIFQMIVCGWLMRVGSQKIYIIYQHQQ